MFEKKIFARVPAWRFALFRSLIALIHILFFLPKLRSALDHFLYSSFREPMIQGLTFPPAIASLILDGQLLMNVLLLIGILSRLSAAFLFLSSIYVFCLDVQNYSHNAQFHFLLLFIIAIADNRLRLTDVFRRKSRELLWEGWPEYLVRFQLSIVFFYAALDKVFSPFWGISGTFFVYEYGLTTNFFKSLALKNPGLSSALVILWEFAIAIAFLFKPLWKWAFGGSLCFVILIEWTVKPTSFTWDLMATLVLFMPGLKRGANQSNKAVGREAKV